jgi:hypothetical protein
VVIRDDDLQAEPAGLSDFLDRGDPAIDGEDEAAAVLRQAGKRLAAQPVALLEAARQVPGGVGAELAQDEHGEGGRGDPVRVVVPVDADALPRRDRPLDRLAGTGHVAEQEGVVPRRQAFEEGARLLGVAVSAPDEDASGDLADVERLGQGARLPVRARTDRPGALMLHSVGNRTEAVGRTLRRAVGAILGP